MGASACRRVDTFVWIVFQLYTEYTYALCNVDGLIVTAIVNMHSPSIVPTDQIYTKRQYYAVVLNAVYRP